MCGIVGFYGFEDDALLERMKKVITHRGPDDHGTYTDGLVSLGLRRLSIIDLSKAGHQPMSNEDGSVWIVYNGEIYNFQELRPKLEKTGHKFSSNTDTEVIIHGYEEWGEDVIKKLHGMFAFALWDSKNKKLILARDRIGIKPLYYTWQDSKFIFASEIKAILEAPFVKREVCHEALYDYMTYINIPAPLTLFDGIFKLKPGHIMIIKDGKTNTKKYWDLLDYKEIDFSITEKEAIRKTEKLLLDSVKERMISDVPQGVFLSGGIDSSTITALMSEMSEEPVNTFSVATGTGEKYNELPYSRIIAEKFETNHTEIFAGIEEIMKFLPKLVHYEDEPIGDPANMPVYYLAKKAKEKGVSVLQVGEGADELFCGYPPYKIELRVHRLIKPLAKMPAFVRKSSIIPAKIYTYFKGKDAQRLLKDQIERVGKGEDFPWHNLLAFTELEKRDLLSKEFQKEKFDSYEMFRKISRSVSLKDSNDWFLQKERMIEIKNRIAELLLMRTDKFTMASSVESRVPFLDHRLVEYEMRVPPYSLQMKDGVYKYILKKAMKDRLPKEILNRRKVGFGVPISEHLERDLKSIAKEEVSHPELRKFINTQYANKVIEQHKTRGFGDTSMRTLVLLNFALWHKYWIRKEKIKI